MARDATLFDDLRLTLEEAIELSAQSLSAYGESHDHWAVAWSGGKDSTATLTLLMHLLESGRVPRPKSLRVFYADTRQELPPLAITAGRLTSQLQERGVPVTVVRAALDKRFLVYMLGRGVPPPTNRFRWCTDKLKIAPMKEAFERELADVDGRILAITGVRLGESAARDARIALSCGRDGAECGQGWYQEALPGASGVGARLSTLSPLLHWRVCHIWDWLKFYAPGEGWTTSTVADAYGGEEAEEINARTGCVGCPLVSRERALETILRSNRWSYLAPLARLKPLYAELREARHRLRKTGLTADGMIATGKESQRLGPLTLEARRMALTRVLEIQAACNTAADARGLPCINILDAEEEARIRELIAAETWPQGWRGDEPTGAEPMDRIGDEWSLPFVQTGAYPAAARED
ncbi:phosphoadenosine phosphosulfate reductase domain-containing protein [Azospirillum sp. sgz302134]